MHKILLVILGIFFFRHNANSQTPSPRIKTNIDFNWRFYLGDVQDGQSSSLNDKHWKLIDVPHDFSMEGKYDSANSPANAYLPGGIGWYRKSIEWNKGWTNKLVLIDFDGVYRNSKVWINGHFLGEHINGYLGYQYNLTPYLKRGKNIIAVRVDNSRIPSARWYTGSGIDRHAWLITTGKIHVAFQGTYVRTPEVDSQKATVLLTTTINNGIGKSAKVQIISAIVNKAGKEVAARHSHVFLNTGDSNIADTFHVVNPSLWSPGNPVIYYLRTSIKYEDRIVDTYTTPFGIRKLEFSPVFGFKLNGKVLKIRGVCNHDNMSPVGTAMPDDMIHFRLQMLKDMGCNAIRTTHNPRSPVFYNMCDTMGIMVLDEMFDGWNYPKAKYDYGIFWNRKLPNGEEEWKKDLTDFIKRARNHPAVIIWGQGNELDMNKKEMEVQKQIYTVFHTLDSTRPVTQGLNSMESLDEKNHVDITGFNWTGEVRHVLEDYHKKHPNMPMIGTEMPHTLQTRGVYRTMAAFNPWDKPYSWTTAIDSAKEAATLYPLENYSHTEIFTHYDPRYASGYDNQSTELSVREAYKQVQRYPFFMGGFRWTGFDYLGESRGWPARTNNFGVIDLAGFPKDDYYLYQSLWTTKPMVHLLPDWTHPGMEGVEIPVVVYTNGTAAELFLNGKPLGKKKMNKQELQMVWQVPYQPGKLLVVAYRNGKIVARDSSITSGPAAGIKLIPNKKQIHANRRDVVRIETDIVDAKGNFDPIANDSVHFEIAGPYKLLGVENGDILDGSPNKVNWRKTFMGKAVLILQSTGKSGVIHITATGKGLREGRARVVVVK